ncbi:hypothetical protein ACFQE5_18840 [Pseudonocardia hispaniensis]|uniref:Terminase small subunit n=1 Tax=Pseudonocardia hispaniensis TaxID=904933 RepID=A0ABW1J5Y1_9PSEU
MADQDWTPAFPGQRPPFRPGNTAALTHGANSERRVSKVAAEIEQTARTDPAWPGYLDDPAYTAAVRSWARSEAIVHLLGTWLDAQDIDAWMVSTVDSTTDTEKFEGGARTRTRARRVGSVLEQLRLWEASAARQRQRLGLDPLSRARLGRDVTAQRVDLVELLTRAAEQRDRDAASAPDAAVGGRSAPSEDGGKGASR